MLSRSCLRTPFLTHTVLSFPHALSEFLTHSLSLSLEGREDQDRPKEDGTSTAGSLFSSHITRIARYFFLLFVAGLFLLFFPLPVTFHLVSNFGSLFYPGLAGPLVNGCLVLYTAIEEVLRLTIWVFLGLTRQQHHHRVSRTHPQMPEPNVCRG